MSTKESLEDCGISISANNTSTGTVGPWKWEITTPQGAKTVSNPTAKNLSSTKISSFYDSGKAVIKLTATDAFGNPANTEKSITVAKRSITLDGKACPKL